MDEAFGNVVEALARMRVYQTREGLPSHKHVFLAALADLYEADPNRPNRFPLDTELEAAFDLAWIRFRQDVPPPNAIEYPFYHLQFDGFWCLLIKSGLEDTYASFKETRLTKKRLIETVDYAYLRSDFDQCFRDASLRSRLVNTLLLGHLSARGEECEDGSSLERIRIEPGTLPAPNPFVAYLNTLHSRDAANENAVAESQACNPDFARIMVRHPLTDVVLARLNERPGESVILTGHAGDGKSTLALAVYKRLKGMDEFAPLTERLQRREEVPLADGTRLAIIKDLSEWPLAERSLLLTEALSGLVRLLLVTNTGALLETLCDYAARHDMGSRADWEADILATLDAEAGDLQFGRVMFRCFNLALRDNLSLTRQIFERMLDEGNWRECQEGTCSGHCPIYRNVQLLRHHGNFAVERIFLAYRRMHEYGTRLTVRQLTAHLAYMITAGLQYADVQAFDDQSPPLMTDYLFCNRFFGDTGRQGDERATRMRVIQEVAKQGFGERPCPTTERHLWLLTHGDSVALGIPMLEQDFGRLRTLGSQTGAVGQAVTPDQARQQIRRMLFFLHDFPSAEEGDRFVRQFLGSLAIVRWMRWQEPAARLSMEEASQLTQRVLHVLQEQFSGIRLPEIGGAAQSHLYVTLSRRRQDIRQSAQVVLALVDFANEFKLTLAATDHAGKRRDLMLVGQGSLDGIELPLSLPFLDYVLARHQGQVSETLQASFADRLERLKADLIRRRRSDSGNEMLLVRLRANRVFARQRFAVSEGALEVSNA